MAPAKVLPAKDPDKMLLAEVKALAARFGFTVHKWYGTERNYTVNCKKL